jgi:GGDEF domain-containing protein
VTARAKDGRPVPVELSVARMSWPEEALLVVFLRDNLRQRCVAAELRRTERYLELFGQFSRLVPLRGDARPAWRTVCDSHELGLAQAEGAADVAQDADYVQASPLVRAELAIPIRLHDEVLGVLSLETSDPSDFSNGSNRILSMLADQVAGAIQLAMTNRHLQRTAEQLAVVNAGLQETTAQLEELSHTDALTGAANRRHFDAQLAKEWQRAHRYASPLSIALLDLDGFKELNDQLGHQAGDACLQWLADVLRGHARRAGALVARLGGDEFAVLLPGLAAAGRRRGALQGQARRRQPRRHGEAPVVPGGRRSTAPAPACGLAPAAALAQST